MASGEEVSLMNQLIKTLIYRDPMAGVCGNGCGACIAITDATDFATNPSIERFSVSLRKFCDWARARNSSKRIDRCRFLREQVGV